MEPFNKPSQEARKKFAREQLQFLKDQGISDNLRLSRIFKAAGPGQVKAAWDLVGQAKTQVQKDTLDCLVTGVGGSQDFGRERMEEVLKACGFTLPTNISNDAFSRIIDGALEILVPGAYDFEPVELQEIEEGVRRLKHNGGKKEGANHDSRTVNS